MVALPQPALAPPKACARAGIPVWHVVISGFTQTLEKPSGCQSLWDAVRRARRNCLDSAVLLQPWNADWAGLADLIWRFRPFDRPPRVYVYAYSWGGGWGFPRLARELDERGIAIEHAVLCDAVYRPRWRLLAGLALTPWPRVVVPANVREVSWFHQRTGLPMGHDVVAQDADRTRVHPGVLVRGVTHHFMDDQNCWFLKCLDVAGQARPADPAGSLLERLNVFPSSL